jgi:hypothetical protein
MKLRILRTVGVEYRHEVKYVEGTVHEVDAEEAKQLLALGLAEEVDASKKAKEAEPEKEPEPPHRGRGGR